MTDARQEPVQSSKLAFRDYPNSFPDAIASFSGHAYLISPEYLYEVYYRKPKGRKWKYISGFHHDFSDAANAAERHLDKILNTKAIT